MGTYREKTINSRCLRAPASLKKNVVIQGIVYVERNCQSETTPFGNLLKKGCCGQMAMQSDWGMGEPYYRYSKVPSGPLMVSFLAGAASTLPTILASILNDSETAMMSSAIAGST